MGDSRAVASLVPSYEMDDFISLERVAEVFAERLDDKPDMRLTIERCIERGVSLAIWKGDGADVWRYEPETEDNHSYPLMGRGDYITCWINAFFLVPECIRELYNSKGEVIYCSEFYPCDDSCNLKDRLTIASTSDIGEMTYKDAEKDILAEYDASHTEDLPCREKKLLEALKNSFKDLPNDDGYLEFDINAVKVLRSDFAKLGLGVSKLQQKKPSYSKANSLVSAAYTAYDLEFGKPPSDSSQLLTWLLDEGGCIGFREVKKEGNKIIWAEDSVAKRYFDEAFEKLVPPSSNTL